MTDPSGKGLPRYVDDVDLVPSLTGTERVEVFPAAGDHGKPTHTTVQRIADLAGGGGGGSAGSPIVRKFPFAFDSPNILTGHTIYTPTVGDILLDAWIEIDTAWDGTTPSGDIGTFSGQSYGLYAHALAPIDMRITDDEGGGVGLQTGTVPNLAATDAISVAEIGLSVSGANLAFRPLSVLTGARSRGIFTASNSIKVVVSQDGTNTGADPGSTQGAGVVYLVTATPQ